MESFVILKPISEDNIEQIAYDFGWEDSDNMLQDLGMESEELYDLYIDEIDLLTESPKIVNTSNLSLWKKNITLFTIISNRVFKDNVVALTDGEFAYIPEKEYEKYISNI